MQVMHLVNMKWKLMCQSIPPALIVFASFCACNGIRGPLIGLNKCNSFNSIAAGGEVQIPCLIPLYLNEGVRPESLPVSGRIAEILWVPCT